MSDEKPTDPPKVLYSPPAPEALDAYARQVCHKLGVDYSETHVVEGFSAFLKVVTDILTKHLNKLNAGQVDNER